MRVLSAQGVEFESKLPFAGLSALLHPLVEHLEEIPASQASALAGALALGPPVAGDRFRIYAGTLSLLAVGAEERPLLCRVDDAHWLDPGSLEALLFAARRLEAEGIALLLAVRDREGREVAAAGLPELVLVGLDRRAAVDLLRRESGTTVADTVAERCHRETRGNPLALIELTCLLSEAQLAGREGLEEPLPTGGSIERAFLRRIKRLPRETQRALVVAAAGDAEKVDAVSSALRSIGIDPAALESAESAALVHVAGGELRFSHPLIRSAVYHRTRPARRRAAHTALAAALNQQPERRAWHLAAAATGPDEAVAEALERAALGAAARSAHGTAASAFERAARLTPDERKRAERLLAAAREAKLAGHIETAIRLLDEGLPLAHDPVLRADLQRLRAAVDVWRGMPLRAHELLVKEAGRVEALDQARATAMLVDSTLPASLAGDGEAMLAAARRACEALAPEAGLANSALGIGLMLSGQLRKARSLLLEVQPLIESADPLVAYEILHMQGRGLMLLGEHAAARAVLEGIVSAAREAAAPGILPIPLTTLAELDFRTGRWAEASAGATESVRLAEETGQGNEYCLVTLALVEAGLGEEEPCREHAAEGLELANARGNVAIVPWARAALGFLELSLGEAELAVAEFERAVRAWEGGALGVRLHWGADLVEAYRRAGRHAEASRELGGLEKLAREGGIAELRATAARCSVVLAPDDEIDAAFREALHWLNRTGMPFERARTELTYGERLRRAKRLREARVHLRLALDVFETLGAVAWTEWTRSELRASGAALRLPAGTHTRQLTPQELQVALVVAKGATNKEAAAALFLSPKTIDFHLGHVYRKLGIRSRVELAHALAPDEAAERFKETGDLGIFPKSRPGAAFWDEDEN
jgi:DNA-binding CsgD family transcriptional regulator